MRTGQRGNPEPLAGELGALARAALSLVIPPLCVVCEKQLASWETWICARCSLVVSMSAHPRSRLVPIKDGRCLRVHYALEYTPLVSRMIWEMKYSDKPSLATFLVQFLWLGAGDELSSDAVIVPVPIHPAKRRERGYNQSEILSWHMGRLKKARVLTKVLQKRRNTPSQTTLEKDARLRNVVGSFRVRDVSDLRSRRVVLIDDVATTGSTLRACAEALLDHGVEDISACVVASSV